MRQLRKRSEPWIFRWARPLIVAIALFGATLTTYLTITHFAGSGPALCTAQGEGCDLVLSSEYAKIFGIPLTIFGALGYLTLAGLASAPWLLAPKDDFKSREKLKKQTAFLLFLVSTATFVFSGYLMYLLAFVIKDANGQAAFCVYCVTSAVNMTAIWLLNLFGHDWEDSGQLFFTGLIMGVLVVVGASGLYSIQSRLTAQNQTFAGRLVQHLKSTNTKMYGAFWCPHCENQKALFGDLSKQVPYIECDPRGENPQAKLCQEKQIKSFPTWEFKDKLYEGERTLDQLADLTGYSGARN
jgi:uncharacterized membrane protein/glutaredoxin